MAILEYRKISNVTFTEFQSHMHDSYEIYYFVKGDVEIRIEGHIYKLSPHTVIIIPPNTIHGSHVSSRADYVRYCIYLSPEEDILPERMHLLKRIIPNYKDNPSQEILYENVEDFRLEDFFYNIKQLDGQPEEVRSVLEPIFSEALVAQLYLMCTTLKPSSINRTPQAEKVSGIVSYINRHLTDPIELDTISARFFLSKNYLNKIFKDTVGTTVMEYIRYKRILLASQYIRNGENSMRAAMLSGFSDYSTFYRTYTKYMKESPREAMEKDKL